MPTSHALLVSFAALLGEPPALSVQSLQSGTATIGEEVVDALRARPRGVGPRRMLRIEGFPLGDGVQHTLNLEEKSVLAGDFRIEVESRSADGSVVRREMARPAVRCYGGTVEGVAGSDLWIAAWDGPDAAMEGGARTRSSGFLYGFIRLPDGMRMISTPPARLAGRESLPAVVFDPARLPQSELLAPGIESFCSAASWTASQDRSSAAPPGRRAGAGSAICRELSVALDTDTAFTRDLFDGDADSAAAYAVALLSALGEIAERDLGTRFKLRYLRLHDPDAPFVHARDVLEVVADWHRNMTHVPRDFVHMLSGGGGYSGEALLGEFCFDPGRGLGGGYGTSRGLRGAFPYPLADFTTGFEDLFLVGHEIGHTLGAPHTFQSSPPFESCGVHGACPPGATGSLMSYCVLCPGGTANAALRYHPNSASAIEAAFAAAPCAVEGGESPIARDDSARSINDRAVSSPVLLNDRGSACSDVELAWHAPTSALGCAVERFVGVDGRHALRALPLPGVRGFDTVDYGTVDAEGASAAAVWTIEWIEAEPATRVHGALPGLSVAAYDIVGNQVFPDLDAMEPFLVTTVRGPSHWSSEPDPVPPTDRTDHVALRFEGWIDVPSTELCAFWLVVDDGAKVWIDGVLRASVVGAGSFENSSFELALEAGLHRLQIDYLERTGVALLDIWWQVGAEPAARLPPARLVHGGAVRSADLDADGAVDANDLRLLLGAWGACDGCRADLHPDGSVDMADLMGLLEAWTARVP